MKALGILVAAASLLSTQSMAQTAEPPASTVDDVVVTGELAEAIDGFVDSMTQPGTRGQFGGQVARWNRPVCLRVVGTTREPADALEAAIGNVIQSLEIPVGGEGCAPNALLVISDDADVFSRDFADRHRSRRFENRRQVIDEFVAPARAVRWHHRTSLVGTGSGPTIDTLAGATGRMGGQLPNTRLRMSTAAQIDTAIVVIDRDRMQYVGTDALVAYLAFAILLDLPPTPPISGRDTVLNLFTDDDEAPLPTGLTAWDRAFVRGIYASRPDQRFSVQQADVAATMKRAFHDGAF